MGDNFIREIKLKLNNSHKAYYRQTFQLKKKFSKLRKIDKFY